MKLTGTDRQADRQGHVLSQADALTKIMGMNYIQVHPFHQFCKTQRSAALSDLLNYCTDVNKANIY